VPGEKGGAWVQKLFCRGEKGDWSGKKRMSSTGESTSEVKNAEEKGG